MSPPASASNLAPMHGPDGLAVPAGELPAPAVEIAASDPRVVVVGRSVHEDGCVKFDWVGTRICFRVLGAPERVLVRMAFEDDYFSVFVDGALYAALSPFGAGFNDHTLVGELRRDATIELCKRTEGYGSPVQVSRILLVPQAGSAQLPTLGCAPALPERAIEFVGDSDTTGFANLSGRTPIPDYFDCLDLQKMLRHSDVEHSWPTFVAAALAAVPHVVALAGIGAMWSPSNEPPVSMCEGYGRMLSERTHTSSRHAASCSNLQPVRLVVVYLGGNDYQELGSRSPDEFVAGYVALLRHVRSLRPGVPILCLMADATSGASCYTREDQAMFSRTMSRLVAKAVHAAGGESAGVHHHIVHPDPPLDVDDDADWAGFEHWSVRGHEKWARGVIPTVRELMGWFAEDHGPPVPHAATESGGLAVAAREVAPAVRHWEVVGGRIGGGLLVRAGPALTSAALAERLATGARVEALEVSGIRMKYRLVCGDGPSTGWVSTRIKGQRLLAKCH